MRGCLNLQKSVAELTTPKADFRRVCKDFKMLTVVFAR